MGSEEPAPVIVFCGGPISGAVHPDKNLPYSIAVGVHGISGEQLSSFKYRRVIFANRAFNVPDEMGDDPTAIATLIFNTIYEYCLGNDPRAGKHFMHLEMERCEHVDGKRIKYTLKNRVFKMLPNGRLLLDPSATMDYSEVVNITKCGNLGEAIKKKIKKIFSLFAKNVMEALVDARGKELLCGNDFKNQN